MSFVEHIPRTGGEPYLTRYNIVKTRWFKVCLHRFHAPDGACLHDHPVGLVGVAGAVGWVHRGGP